MKIQIVLLAFLLIGTMLPTELLAQTPANPDLTRMRLLLAKIADCNTDIKDQTAEIEAFKKISSEASRELYNQLKKNVAIATRCKAASQKEYDALKADYEGWFKQSTSFMVVDRERITPASLHLKMVQLAVLYVALNSIFKKIPVPTH